MTDIEKAVRAWAALPVPCYCMVITSFDACFIGPFKDHIEAEGYAADERINQSLDVYVMTEQEMRKNLFEYGPAPIYPPESW